MQIPHIHDAYTLTRAVQLDPELAFQQLQKFFQERNELKIQVNSLLKEVESVKSDYVALMKGHERMEEIWLEKQRLIWQFVNRIQAREGGRVVKKDDDAAAGEWMQTQDEQEKENNATKEDVEKIWTQHLRLGSSDSDVQTTNLSPFYEEERGRSRIAKLLPRIESDERSTIGAETSTGMSVADSVIESIENTDIKLDPNAVIFLQCLFHFLLLISS